METQPKKRGRKPLSDAEKEGRAQKKRADKVAQARPLHISFMRDHGEQSSAAHVLPAHEVIQLLNTSSSHPIPQRTTELQASTTQKKKRGETQFLAESDDDEDFGSGARTQRHLGNISAEQIVTLMGAHTNVNTYPASTSVLCHYCAHGFTGIPVMLPRMRCVVTKRFEVSGTFCSFNCAKRHALDSNKPRSSEMAALCADLYKCVTSVRQRVIPAPPRIALKAFGGIMTIEEYRAGFLTLPPSTLDEPTSKIIVKQLQENCWPVLAKLHITNEQAVVDERILGPRPRRSIPKYDRCKPLRDSAFDGMNVNLSVLRSDEDNGN